MKFNDKWVYDKQQSYILFLKGIFVSKLNETLKIVTKFLLYLLLFAFAFLALSALIWQC